MLHNARRNSKDDYETPRGLFDKIMDVFDFTTDMAANYSNTLCDFYECERSDALSKHWGEKGSALWCNPPFSQKEAFLKRGVEGRNGNKVIVFLVPNNARESKWWNNYALQADLVINLTPRVNFCVDGEEVTGVGFGSCLLVYYPRIPGVDYGNPKEIYWNWKLTPAAEDNDTSREPENPT